MTMQPEVNQQTQFKSNAQDAFVQSATLGYSQAEILAWVSYFTTFIFAVLFLVIGEIEHYFIYILGAVIYWRWSKYILNKLTISSPSDFFAQRKLLEIHGTEAQRESSLIPGLTRNETLIITSCIELNQVSVSQIAEIFHFSTLQSKEILESLTTKYFLEKSFNKNGSILYHINQDIDLFTTI